ncbi:MFS transporter [Nocardiopsis terrae]|uniref:MFS family arabinose efflux permease n=1 Tax=Nocardiopsis terrae TaxID=372655 RepID=A0ABR9HB59_9ACTN|nr:MFS transporter [Nocardiopsis terrae]MBE1456238.1 putative MFS family arabinose efflux permease [Nocardiopsis terrae]GHC77998.1 MFS transporter [Nocardiopsis terrae]
MPTHTLRSGWLACLALTAFAVGTDDLVIAGLLPAIAQDLDVSVAVAGQLVTVFSLTYAVAAPPLAVATARAPRRALLLVGLALFALANLVTALAPTYAVLMAMRVVAALIAATLTPAAFSMAARLAPPERTGRAVGAVAAGLTVALFLGVPIGAFLGSALGWRSAFVAVALLTCAVLAASALRLPGLPGAPETGVREQLRHLGRPALLLCVTGTVMGATCGFMTYTYIAPITLDLTGATGAALSPLIAVVGAAGAVGTLLCGRATDLWGADRVLLAAFGGMVATSLALTFLGQFGAGAAPVWTLGCVLALWGFAAWGFAAPMNARLLRLAGDAGTEALALNTGGLYVGTAVAGAVGGTVVAGAGGSGVPLVATVIGLAALAVMALSVRWFPTSAPTPAEPSRADAD